MATRHIFSKRGSGPLRRRFPRQCIVMGEGPVPAVLHSVQDNQAVIEAAVPMGIGQRVELHHAEAGMIPANVVATTGQNVALAFNTGNRAIAFAVHALAKATLRAI